MTSRQFRRALNLISATALAAAVLLPALTVERPAAEGGWVAHSQVEAAMAHHDKPANRPVWRDAYTARFAGCTEQRTVRIPGAVVAVDLTGRVERVATDEAWQRASRGDFWVVGFCQ